MIGTVGGNSTRRARVRPKSLTPAEWHLAARHRRANEDTPEVYGSLREWTASTLRDFGDMRSDLVSPRSRSIAFSIVDDEWIKPDRLTAVRTFGKQARVIPRLSGKFRAGRIVRREIRDACNIRNRVEDRPRRYKTPAATFAQGSRSCVPFPTLEPVEINRSQYQREKLSSKQSQNTYSTSRVTD